MSAPSWQERFLSSNAARQSPARAAEILREFEARAAESRGFIGVAHLDSVQSPAAPHDH